MLEIAYNCDSFGLCLSVCGQEVTMSSVKAWVIDYIECLLSISLPNLFLSTGLSWLGNTC